ncbi:expressed unknown protein [Seminavis robusta]|uniref:Uncharacterized protein n=1 Tax=Seminavis robusta TaxID=568900 RepID=A0A9N8DKD8_9STRA|nr:expressed unknown protein [Seminavis robusta]|eukprot:Sro133_g063190.1 n/a (480) ;mRNA; r:89508-91100
MPPPASPRRIKKRRKLRRQWLKGSILTVSFFVITCIHITSVTHFWLFREKAEQIFALMEAPTGIDDRVFTNNATAAARDPGDAYMPGLLRGIEPPSLPPTTSKFGPPDNTHSARQAFPSTGRKSKTTIGYAVTITSCNINGTNADTDTDLAVILDAAAVLEHSIHLAHHQSTKYDYQMHAFVYRSASSSCPRLIPRLSQLGYNEQLLHNHNHLKLLNEATNRSTIPFLQWPFHKHQGDNNPQSLEALLVRDYSMVNQPSNPMKRRVGVQSGFWIVKPNPYVYMDLLDMITEPFHAFVQGRGGKKVPREDYVHYGHDAPIQELLSYYYRYGQVHPNSVAELHHCHYQSAAAPPQRQFCSNQASTTTVMNCADCRHTPLDEVYTIHFTSSVCQKPWQCLTQRDTPQCSRFLLEWHRIRYDLEEKRNLVLIPNKYWHLGQVNASSRIDVIENFEGHCRELEEGQKYQYVPIHFDDMEEEAGW